MDLGIEGRLQYLLISQVKDEYDINCAYNMKNVHEEHETIHFITYSWVYLFSIYLKFSHLRFTRSRIR